TMSAALLRPIVHPWMTVDPALVRHAATRLDDLAPRLAAATARMGLAADARTRVLQAVESVREAMADLARALMEHGGSLRTALRGRPYALAELRRHTDALSEADARCRAALVDAAAGLPSLDDLVDSTAWDGPGLDAMTREALDEVPTHALPALYARHPALLAAVTDPDDDTPPEWVSDLLDAARFAETGPGASLRCVDALRRGCVEHEAELERAALLHPRLFGGLDGVPLLVRMRANRLIMRADLARMRTVDADFENVIADLGRREGDSLLRKVGGRALDAWLANDEITAMVTVENHDRPGAQRVEHRALVTLTQQLLHDRVDQGRGVKEHRQVLVFDTSGRIVELWGHLDEHTRRVAVFVGGTGTTVRQFGWPTALARGLREAADGDAPGTTAVVTWMGSRFPQAMGTQSPFGRFARVAAAPLRDHVEGLSVPDGVPITVVGHSYGGVVVGAAEALGLRADRVVHAGVPGVGPGVRSAADYPSVDALGRPRVVRRYCLTAPGDLIRLWQGSDAPLATLPFTPAKTAARWISDRTLGADPTRLPEVVTLDTGIWERDRDDRRAGEILFGPRGHADVVEPGTTSFRRIVAIICGEDPAAISPPPTITPFRWYPGRRGDAEKAQRRARLRAEAEALRDDPEDRQASRELAAEMDSIRAW
ncbi:MAG: alpha/beta hydrolase, partial [Mobilicoccus sp.]|nr:alpha/beta hydrolase [Mobilicoccus sp.]